MNYVVNPKTNDTLSILGYGCLRFTKKGTSIDQAKAESEMSAAIERGVNYFDTAYIYPGNEVTLGKFLSKGLRGKVNIATKLPHYLLHKTEDIERIFSEELQRLQTDHIDYYLMHMLPGIPTWERLCNLGIREWIASKKKSGQIRNVGFSFHGGTHSFISLVDAYPWDFCQIQYNYMDEYAQAGVGGLQYAAEKGLLVVIMEPLKGGRLANNLPKAAKKMLQAAHPDWSPAEWGLRWLWRQKEVGVVLSGMNALEQVLENTRIASFPRENLLSEKELAVLDKAKKIIDSAAKINCTGCGYCMPCPAGVDIPVCFRCYNDLYTESRYIGFKEYLMCTTLKAKPTSASVCVKCGRCETRCPQKLPIRKELERVRKKIETPLYSLIKKGAKLFYKF